MIGRPNRGIWTSLFSRFGIHAKNTSYHCVRYASPYAEERQEEGYDLCTFVFCRGVHSQALSKKCEKRDQFVIRLQCDLAQLANISCTVGIWDYLRRLNAFAHKTKQNKLITNIDMKIIAIKRHRIRGDPPMSIVPKNIWTVPWSEWSSEE